MESILYIDLDEFSLIATAFTVGRASRGSITVSDLRAMTYKEFSFTDARARELLKAMEEGDG